MTALYFKLALMFWLLHSSMLNVLAPLGAVEIFPHMSSCVMIHVRLFCVVQQILAGVKHGAPSPTLAKSTCNPWPGTNATTFSSSAVFCE